MFADDVTTNEKTVDTHKGDLRRVLIKLSESGKITHSSKYIKKASDATLLQIHTDYNERMLDETNDKLTKLLISKFADLMRALEAVDDDDEMENELLDNTMFRDDLKRIIGVVTPYVPYVGLVTGGVTIGKHVMTTNKNVDVHEGGEDPVKDSPDLTTDDTDDP